MPLCDNSCGKFALAVAFLYAGTLYFCFSRHLIFGPISNLELDVYTTRALRKIEFPVDELEAALDRAAAGFNRTVIIAMVNKAYIEEVEGRRTIMDLFLESFGEGEGTLPLLDHLLVIAADQKAYDHCRFRRLHCYKMDTKGIDLEGEKVYMSHDFIEMMWRRTLLLLDVLRHGYHILFTDTDVMWLRSPFHRLSTNGSLDMQISVDVGEEKHGINTGFYYVRSNNRTISLFQKWYDMRLNSTGMKEQDVLKNLLDSGFFDQLGLTVGFLNTTYFSGFCQDSKDMSAVTTVHANCCRYIPAKVSDLTLALGDWKRYKVSHVNTKWSRHSKCWRSWNETHYNPRL